MQLAEREQCTGCGACKASCPRGAISFREDEAGFPAPQIDSAKCVDCGLCGKACPALRRPGTQPVRAAYAAQILDRDALADSTSGGLFTAFAREIFRRGGTVYGCVWDEQYNAVIRRAENEEEIIPMRGSKYVWSWAGDAYPEVRRDLEAGRPVLFVGTPCQAAGLRTYLGKDCGELYLVDFLCSGCPSPLAFRSWLKTIRGRNSLRDLHLKFRDKHPYGVGVHITYKGQRHRTARTGEHIRNPYYYSFYIRLLNREACYRCPYGTAERVSDLTVCDYWGVAKYHRDLDIPAGVSGLTVNSDRGAALLASAGGQLLLRETELPNIARENNLSLSAAKSIVRPAYKDAFFSVMKARGWRAAERRYLYTGPRLKLWLKEKLPQKTVKRLRAILPGK